MTFSPMCSARCLPVVPSAVIPVTGLNSAGAEIYGGQNISHLTVTKGQTVTLPLQ